MRISKNKMIAEIARRKVQFHNNENWNEIKLWGLFRWSDVVYYINKGDLITDYQKENITIWVHPSKELWENHIEPMIENNSLEQLTKLAGW